jgi:hypothetical protein
MTNRASSIASGYSQPGKLFLGTNRGLFISDDCGGSWRAVIRDGLISAGEAYIDSIEVDESENMYVGRSRQPFLILRESDTTSHTGVLSLTSGESLGYVMTAYAKVARDGSRSYAILTRTGDRSVTGWAVGEDSGRRWTVVSGQYPVGFFAVAPDRPSVLYFAYKDTVLKSLDEGATAVQHARFALPTSDPSTAPDAEQTTGETARDISIGGHTGTAWIVTQSHTLYRADGDLTSWRQAAGVPTVARTTQFDRARIAASQVDPDVAFFVARDGRLWAYREPPPETSAAP